ncbi:hypothetical protein OH809_18560 [Streptomyces sp. NBC_00873]|uniref:hypothetical protein n=1 Tax=Streptomyces sp. NBC_00873 TaxID=2975852 RepID=UPI00386A8D3C|nr:hypothetical protein OH809_18560 [Streptomyces sp. NBC_00873]
MGNPEQFPHAEYAPNLNNNTISAMNAVNTVNAKENTNTMYVRISWAYAGH